MRIARILLLLLAASLVTASLSLAEDDDDDHGDADRARRGALSGEIMPLSRLAGIVLRRFPGKLIEAELDEDDGMIVYEIRILQRNGRVLELEVDARNARILEVEDDD